MSIPPSVVSYNLSLILSAQVVVVVVQFGSFDRRECVPKTVTHYLWEGQSLVSHGVGVPHQTVALVVVVVVVVVWTTVNCHCLQLMPEYVKRLEDADWEFEVSEVKGGAAEEH